MSPRGNRTLSAAADERYHGHDSAAKYVPHALWLGLIGVFTIPAGFELSVPPWSWVVASDGVLLIACAFGIWCASEWARITSGILVLALAGVFFWMFLPAAYLWFTVLVTCGLLTTGLGLLSPVAARSFRRAREFRSTPHGRWS